MLREVASFYIHAYIFTHLGYAHICTCRSYIRISKHLKVFVQLETFDMKCSLLLIPYNATDKNLNLLQTEKQCISTTQEDIDTTLHYIQMQKNKQKAVHFKN